MIEIQEKNSTRNLNNLIKTIAIIKHNIIFNYILKFHFNIAFIIKVQQPTYKIDEKSECCTKQHNSSSLVVRMQKWKVFFFFQWIRCQEHTNKINKNIKIRNSNEQPKSWYHEKYS